MKVGLITDIHFGVRSDHPLFYRYMEKFFKDIFFPYIDDNKIEVIINLGDTFDRRKYINFITLDKANKMFFGEIKKRKIRYISIVGNHDTYFKNTNKYNSIDIIYGKDKFFENYTDPTEIVLNDKQILLVPWIATELEQLTAQAIQKSISTICLGHLELAGFELNRGQVNLHGQDSKQYKKFDLVCSGHYHCRSNNGNVVYLGSSHQHTWSDYNDSRGFHILDLSTNSFSQKSLAFIENPYTIFEKIFYTTKHQWSIDKINNTDLSIYDDKYVKLIIDQQKDPYIFDLLVTTLEKAGAADIQIVDDHKHQDIISDVEITSEIHDTMSIINETIDQISDHNKTTKTKIKKLISEIYQNSLSSVNISN